MPAPQKLVDLLQLANGINNAADAVVARRDIAGTYMTQAQQTAYADALAFAQTVADRWTAYAASFTAASPGGGVAPAQQSYHADMDTLTFRAQAILPYDAQLDGAGGIKARWIDANILPLARWPRFNLTQAFIDNQQNELRNSLRGRVRNTIIAALTKNRDWLYAQLGMQNSPTQSWDLGTGIHTTLLKSLGNTTWRMDLQPSRDQAIAAILGAGLTALHATLEQNGNNSPANPKRYWGLASVRPNYVTVAEWTAMDTALNAREAAIRNLLVQRSAQLGAAHLVAGWEG